MLWYPDTCDCVLQYDKGHSADTFVRILVRCKLHVKVKDSDIHDTLIAHNMGFNLKYGSEPTDEQIDEMINNKKAEKERIKELDVSKKKGSVPKGR